MVCKLGGGIRRKGSNLRPTSQLLQIMTHTKNIKTLVAYSVFLLAQ